MDISYEPCSLCFDDISSETFVKYQQEQKQNQEWKPFAYCKECLGLLMESQWNTYIDGLRKADCEATLKKLIERGPPTHFRDPRIENGSYLVSFMCNSDIISGKLQGPLDEEKMNSFNDKLKEILPLLNSDHDVEYKNRNKDDPETLDYMGCINKVLDEFCL